jgi:hypothetical protein
MSRDGIPADVIGLVAAGKKIHAIEHYRELTGAARTRLRSSSTASDPTSTATVMRS